MSGLTMPLSVALPLVVAALLALVRRPERARRIVLLGTLGLLLVHHVVLLAAVADGTVLATRVGGWPGGVAITFVLDTFSALMLVATSLLALVCAWFAVAAGEDERPMLAPLVLVLVAGVAGVLLTGDLFNMFVFLEVTLMPSYALMSMSADRGRFAAGRVFVSLSLLTSTVFLIAVGLVYGTAGTVDLASLDGAAADSPPLAAAGAILLVALGVKSALVPAHGWLAETYPHASPGMTALFSGLHTKLGLYAIYRLYSLLYGGEARFAWIAVGVCVLSMIVGVLAAFGQRSMRSILAFHMVSQNGYIALGAVLLAPAGAAAGIFYMMHHMTVKASLVLSAGAIEHRYGTGRLASLGRLARREPLIAVAFIVPALSLAGMPPFSGFLAKYVLVRAALSQEQYLAAVAAVMVGALTLASMIKIWQSVFITDPEDDDHRAAPLLTAVPAGLVGPALSLAAVTVIVGLSGDWLLALCEQAGRGLADYTAYTEAVID